MIFFVFIVLAAPTYIPNKMQGSFILNIKNELKEIMIKIILLYKKGAETSTFQLLLLFMNEYKI